MSAFDRPVRVRLLGDRRHRHAVRLADVLAALDDEQARAAYLSLGDRVACPGCCNCQPANYDDPRCDGDGLRKVGAAT